MAMPLDLGSELQVSDEIKEIYLANKSQSIIPDSIFIDLNFFWNEILSLFI
jgi:hypothetical protein